MTLDESDEDLRHYTTAQVAELLQVTAETVRNWIDAGKIKASRFNNQYRISKPDLKRFVEERHGSK